MQLRNVTENRKTTETEINVSINPDGTGKYNIDIPVPFLKHMLELFSKHAGFDIDITAKGDVDVDDHHTVEDIGICIGKCFKKIYDLKNNILRYGFFQLPMDESLVSCAIDFSNRPFLMYNVKCPTEKTGVFDTKLVESFFHAIVINSGLTLHINLDYGNDSHHIIEAVFKCFARTMKQVLTLNKDDISVPSTKGVL